LNERVIMRIGMKYCGGCNPRFRRGSVAERLRRDFPDIELVPAEGPGPQLDLVVIVCGCPSACATLDGRAGIHGSVLMADEEEYEKVAFRVSAAEAS
jgi:4-hydroxybutyrate CoA-transferase